MIATPQLLEEIAAGSGLGLAALAGRVPSRRKGRPVTLSCVLRWIISGSPSPSGQTIRLEAVRSPSGWLSTPQALARFFAALTPETAFAALPAQRTPSKREAANARAARELEALGI